MACLVQDCERKKIRKLLGSTQHANGLTRTQDFCDDFIANKIGILQRRTPEVVEALPGRLQFQISSI
jgi:hypothetical protein